MQCFMQYCICGMKHYCVSLLTFLVWWWRWCENHLQSVLYFAWARVSMVFGAPMVAFSTYELPVNRSGLKNNCISELVCAHEVSLEIYQWWFFPYLRIPSPMVYSNSCPSPFYFKIQWILWLWVVLMGNLFKSIILYYNIRLLLWLLSMLTLMQPPINAIDVCLLVRVNSKI